jgi:transcriptional regulator with XRE-family HTH domain
VSASNDTWGDRIRSRRQALRWSLADLAKQTGLSRAYISALERGRSKRPSAETVKRLEEALGPLTGLERSVEPPPGLAALAAEQGLAEQDVADLASLRIRGRQPQTKERWSFIYQALLASESIDEEPYVYRRDRTTGSR